MTIDWEKEQEWERQWHLNNNNCANSYNEETKQYGYAHLMGLDKYATNYYGVRGWNFEEQSVLDVGGGPYSMLLKARAKRMVVLDPCDYPNWVAVRYRECDIEYVQRPAEIMEFDTRFDIALCYNVLQHTLDPEEICKRMRQYSNRIHFFDWVDTPKTPGHPHTLTEENLNKWLGGTGKVAQLSNNGLYGKAYYGVFLGDK